jgi:diaminohydroxyphosphoribosylaminopyrimidine deaminase/5-amino-6-(5-phosphoribosylamino)uracil reductase
MFDKSTFDAPAYVATTNQMPQEKRNELQKRSIKVLLLPQKENHIDLKVLLQELYKLGIYSILAEGGARLSGALLREQLVDKVVCHIAPMIIGEGISMTSGLEVHSLDQALRLQDVQTATFGLDGEISGYLEPWASQMSTLYGEKVPAPNPRCNA